MPKKQNKNPADAQSQHACSSSDLQRGKLCEKPFNEMPAQLFPRRSSFHSARQCNQPVNISQSCVCGMREFSARRAERCMQFVWCALHMWHNMRRDRSHDPSPSATGGWRRQRESARGWQRKKRGWHKFVSYFIFFQTWFVGLVGQRCWLKRLFKTEQKATRL